LHVFSINLVKLVARKPKTIDNLGRREYGWALWHGHACFEPEDGATEEEMDGWLAQDKDGTFWIFHSTLVG